MTKKIEKYKKYKKYYLTYLEIAENISKLSHAKRKKVGAIIVKNNSIISDGYNGTPPNIDNCCEDYFGKTHWYVLHAEANAILKVARSNNNIQNSTLYTTLSPCKECAKLILQSKIKKVFYLEEYKDLSGINFLNNYGIKCYSILKNGM